MSGDSFTLHQTNDLARKFYSALGLRISGHVKFWESDDDEIKQMCWKMASIAQMELSGIDVAEHVPKSQPAKLISIEERINKARVDGKVTAGRAAKGGQDG